MGEQKSLQEIRDQFLVNTLRDENEALSIRVINALTDVKLAEYTANEAREQIANLTSRNIALEQERDHLKSQLDAKPPPKKPAKKK